MDHVHRTKSNGTFRIIQDIQTELLMKMKNILRKTGYVYRGENKDTW